MSETWEPKFLSRWRHQRRGTSYNVVTCMAQAQCSNGPLNEGDWVTIYRGDDGNWWIRKTEEFQDGRFERIDLTEGWPDEAQRATDARTDASFAHHDRGDEIFGPGHSANSPSTDEIVKGAKRLLGATDASDLEPSAEALAIADDILSYPMESHRRRIAFGIDNVAHRRLADARQAAAREGLIAGIRKAADLLEANERNADPRFGPMCLDPIKGLRAYADKEER